MATTYDRRSNSKNTPIWEHACTQMSWANGAGHAAQTETVSINGGVKNITAVISAAPSDPDVTIIIKDLAGNQLYSTGALNDGQTVVKSAATDFYEWQVCGKGFIVSADPDADAGLSGLTVDITIRGV